MLDIWGFIAQNMIMSCIEEWWHMKNPKILHEIINDIAPESTTLRRVGVVGSFARGTSGEHSDIDLVFDSGHNLIDEAILSAGIKIRKILQDQFGMRTDIINYHTIVRKVSDGTARSPELAGYKQMLDDLQWIWAREA